MKEKTGTQISSDLRAARAREAHAAVRDNFKDVSNREDANDPHTMRWHDAIRRSQEAIAAAYPKDFWEALERLRHGNIRGIEPVVKFLEADPIFFRSGYAKEEALAALSRVVLPEGTARRLRAVVLRSTRIDGRREFRRYCRLARAIDSHDLRSGLQQIVAEGDRNSRRRALWMLDAVRQAAEMRCRT